MSKRKISPRKTSRYKRKGLSKKRIKKLIFWGMVVLLIPALLYFFKGQLGYLYAIYLKEEAKGKLTNSPFEAQRIKRIIGENSDNVFGIDISHYQRKEDVFWDSLTIANGSIPIQFVILRGTMGNRDADRHFEEFWQKAKASGLIRGAYHFYRVHEDPVLQAHNFIENVPLESGDLPPILDIEKIPKRKSSVELVKDLKIWCSITEEKYGTKPIIYTYYHYYKDFLRGEFDDYPLWLANYNDVSQPSPEDKWQFWQFTDNGIVKGINVKVDLNIYNGGSWALSRLTLD